MQKAKKHPIIILATLFSLLAFHPASNQRVMLSAGTLVLLELAEELDPFETEEGTTVEFAARQVLINGKVVVAPKSLGQGRVVEIRSDGNYMIYEIVAENIWAVDGQQVSLFGERQTIKVLSYPKKNSTVGKKFTSTILDNMYIYV